jgi:hypothetical protein
VQNKYRESEMNQLKICTAFVIPKTGFGLNAMLDNAGLQQVIKLRTTYVSSRVRERDLSHYRDLRWFPL